MTCLPMFINVVNVVKLLTGLKNLVVVLQLNANTVIKRQLQDNLVHLQSYIKAMDGTLNHITTKEIYGRKILKTNILQNG